MQAGQKELIYLYCVTKDKPPRYNFEDLKVKTYPIYFQGTYAIVSKVSPEDFSEDNLKKNLADMKWVEKNARLHEAVIEEVMSDTAILPFKFATIFKAEENVEKLLKERNADFKKLISGFEGKEEWGLKIYCDLDKFRYLITEEDDSIKKINGEIASCNKGKAFFFKKKRNEVVKDIMNKGISDYTKDCFERLAAISVKTRINKLLPREVTQKNEEMVFNGAFLINKKKISELTNVVDYLQTRYLEKGLSLDCTGPWPPYNFCDLVTKKI